MKEKKTFAIDETELNEEKDLSEEALKIDIELVKKYKGNKEKLISFRKLLRSQCKKLCSSRKMDFSTYEELITLMDSYIENIPVYTIIYEDIEGHRIRKVFR